VGMGGSPILMGRFFMSLCQSSPKFSSEVHLLFGGSFVFHWWPWDVSSCVARRRFVSAVGYVV